MGLKPGKWKLNFRGGKDKWLVILAVGLMFLILAFPTGNKSAGNARTLGSQGVEGQAEEGEATGNLASEDREAGKSWGQGQGEWNLTGGSTGWEAEGQPRGAGSGTIGTEGQEGQEALTKSAAAKEILTYEGQLEERLRELLSHVEGVGQVEVMIVLKSSEEKVWRVDRNTSYSSTQETDSNGGSRNIRSQEVTEDTILSGQGGEGPLLEKEMRPEVSGVVVTASGGGSPVVQAEISAAVEALFDVPSHKIKVLKRAE